MKPEIIIAYSSYCSVLVPLTIAFLHGRYLPNNIKPLRLSLTISLACDAVALVLSKFSIHTHWIGNTYLAAQFFLVGFILRNQFQEKKVADLTLVFFAIFFLVNISFFEGPMVFNSVSNVVASLILIAFCLFYFYGLLNDLPTNHIQSLPMFWVAFGVLTYYAGNFFLFLLKNYLIYGERGSHRLMWILHNLLNIIKNLLFALALWQSYRKMKSSISSSSAP